MIIQLEGAPADTAAAQRDLQDLTRDWGHDITVASAEKTAETRRDDPGKNIDPVSLAALILSIPSTVLAVSDLADRIRKRRRATELIEHAQQLADQQVTLTLVTKTRTVELRTLTPDKLLDLIADEQDSAS
jgi:hypothetical protein